MTTTNDSRRWDIVRRAIASAKGSLEAADTFEAIAAALDAMLDSPEVAADPDGIRAGILREQIAKAEEGEQEMREDVAHILAEVGLTVEALEV